MIESLLGFLLIVTPLVFFHELGHFIFARLAGVQVLVFSVGFGREIFGYTDRLGTRWRLSMIPFGGYVKMSGEARTEDSEEEKGSFQSASLFQRMSIIAAGPLANVILAIVLLAFVNILYGVLTSKNYLEHGIGSVAEGSAAEQVGLRSGDVITAINNVEIQEYREILTLMSHASGAPMIIKFRRGDVVYQDIITPKIFLAQDGTQERYILGVTGPGYQRERMGMIEGASAAVRQSFWLMWQIVNSIGGLINGAYDYRELGGPIKIAQMSGDTLTAGVEKFLLFAAMLSLNLALINMFPIPGLDGGHFTQFIVEGVIRRPLPLGMVHFLNSAGMIFVLILIALVTVKDIFEQFS